MDLAQLQRAVEAARSTASALGLDVDAASVVHNSNRVAVRLFPCEVLVRVAPSVHQADAQFEAEVARRLAGTDAPVAELEPRVEPLAYVRGPFVITFWTYYQPLGSAIGPADYADALLRLHAGLRRIDLETPHVTDRVATAQKELDDHEQTPALPAADRELLGTTLRRLRTVISHARSGEQLLHGEPHPGNVLSTRRGPLFVDLGTCCRGPVEFDLAHAPEVVTDHYPEAGRDLTQQCRVLMWALFTTWRWRRDDQLPDRDHWRLEGLDQVRAGLLTMKASGWVLAGEGDL